MKLFVDTNVFIRFFLNDHKIQSPATKKLFSEAKIGKIRLVTSSLIVAEMVFTLHSFYNQTKQEIIEKIQAILLFKGLEILEKNVLMQAISIYEKEKIDFIDAYVASVSLINGFTVCSFDRDFRKIKEIKRFKL